MILFFTIYFRKSNIEIDDFIFYSFFRTFITFSLFLGFLIYLGWFLGLFKEL